MKKFFYLLPLILFFIACGDSVSSVVDDNDKFQNDSAVSDEDSDSAVSDEDSDSAVSGEDSDSAVSGEDSDSAVSDEDSDFTVSDEDSDSAVSDEDSDSEPSETDDDNNDNEINDLDVENCIEEGGYVSVYPNTPECCEGLSKCIPSEIKYGDNANGAGYCESSVGASVCLNCGNGVCDSNFGENLCNCPEDCVEKRDTECDTGDESSIVCNMEKPDGCFGISILAIINGCWACVDKGNGCAPHNSKCDDGTPITCDMVVPICPKSQILAYRDNCYKCVNPDSCTK